MLIKKDNLSSKGSEIYRNLRELIAYGALNPGEKIIESKLVKDFGVSRTPIREAIRQLETRGFLTTIHNKGTYVKKVSREELERIYDVMSVLEGYAVRLAVENITDQQIGELEELCNTMRELTDLSRFKEHIEKNLKFHFVIAEASQNEFLEDLIRELRDRVYRYRFIGITIPGHVEDYFSDHKSIVNAIKEKDPAKAEEIMRRHIQRGKQISVDYLKEFPA